MLHISHTILNLSDACLDVVERQIAHLVSEAVEIHVSGGNFEFMMYKRLQ